MDAAIIVADASEHDYPFVLHQQELVYHGLSNGSGRAAAPGSAGLRNSATAVSRRHVINQMSTVIPQILELMGVAPLRQGPCVLMTLLPECPERGLSSKISGAVVKTAVE